MCFFFLLFFLAHVPSDTTDGGGAHELYCSQAAGGRPDVLASLLASSLSGQWLHCVVQKMRFSCAPLEKRSDFVFIISKILLDTKYLAEQH